MRAALNELMITGSKTKAIIYDFKWSDQGQVISIACNGDEW